MFVNVARRVHAQKIRLGHLVSDYGIVGIRIQHYDSICQHISSVCILEEIRIISAISVWNCRFVSQYHVNKCKLNLSEDEARFYHKL